MKRISTLLAVCLFGILSTFAQGWPAQYGGVMLQGFYWDSYSDSQWTKLESQADTLSKYFQLVWVPQSGWCNSSTNQMGYAPIWWFDQKSCFGTADELKSMISTFKNKGIKTIADVVINHKSGNTTWCDFPTETWSGHGTITWSLADICVGDDGGKTEAEGYQLAGAKDTGADFDGSRDLDHTSANVQNNIKLYLQFLKEEMGYSGFRYDMTGGYDPKYTKMYNENAQPEFSVGEYWMDDGLSGLQSWINGTGKTSAAFDFQLKWLINDVFNNGTNSFTKLSNYTSKSLIGSGYAQYAVTFADNHDTGRASDNRLKDNVEAANAYILTIPGTPCVWLTHWMSYNLPIKKMILARNIAGVNNQSTVELSNGEANGYSVCVKGTNGKMLLLLGSTTTSTNGYQLVVEGTNYKLYVSDGLDISATKSVKADPQTSSIPECAKPQTGTYAYFEAPNDWGSSIHIWAWKGNGNPQWATGEWPGDTKDVTCVGNTSAGKKVYLWKYSGTLTDMPEKIIFNDGTNQTSNLDFVNGGYYDNVKGYIGTVTGIRSVYVDSPSTDNAWYTLNGMRISKPTQKGIYIHDGKKYVVK